MLWVLQELWPRPDLIRTFPEGSRNGLPAALSLPRVDKMTGSSQHGNGIDFRELSPGPAIDLHFYQLISATGEASALRGRRRRGRGGGGAGKGGGAALLWGCCWGSLSSSGLLLGPAVSHTSCKGCREGGMQG